MKYFEVLYANWHGDENVALVATKHETPEVPTISFDFNWNGNRLIAFRETDRESFAGNVYRFYGQYMEI